MTHPGFGMGVQFSLNTADEREQVKQLSCLSDCRRQSGLRQIARNSMQSSRRLSCANVFLGG